MQSHDVVTLSRRGGGRYAVVDSSIPVELRISGWRYRGEGLVGAQTYHLRRTGWFDRGVEVTAADGAYVLSLSRKHADVPGLPQSTFRVRSRWRGYEGRLTSPGGAELVVRTGHGSRSDVTAEIAGALPQQDLVMLAAAFAVLLRRREDVDGAGAATAASVAATS